MKSSSVQWARELHPLGGPWALVTLGGLLSLAKLPAGLAYSFPRSLLQAILPLGIAFGVPLLAALPIGIEFQCRTMELRLAQPIERRQVWRQKLMVTCAALVPALVIYLVSAWYVAGQHDFWGIAAWLFISPAAAIPSTLIARSMIGGLALSTASVGGPMWAWVLVARHFWGNGPYPDALIWGTVAAIGLYVAGLIWWGQRLLVNFQAIEGLQAGEAVLPGARLVPSFVVEAVRCRPGQPILNLVRRELRLLRMVWPLGLLSIAAWTCLVAFRLLPGAPDSSRVMASLVMTVLLSVLIAVLAGTLSLGEEKTWGTHDTQLVAPISTAAQWLVKLLTALLASLLCAALLPMSAVLIGSWMAGKPLLHAGPSFWIWPLEATLLTLFAFWCSCMVRGTLRAALCVFPLLFLLNLGAQTGFWVWSLVSAGLRGVMDNLVARWDPIRLSGMAARTFGTFTLEAGLGICLAPLVAVVLIQSLRQFRGEPDDSRLHVLRRALPLFALVLLGAFFVSAAAQFMSRAYQQRAVLLRETHSAIAAAQAGSSAAGAQRLTIDDLAKASPISERNRRWLRGSSVIVTPEATRPGGFAPVSPWENRVVLLVPGAPGKAAVSYSAILHLHSGARCSLQFAGTGQGGSGVLSGLCE